MSGEEARAAVVGGAGAAATKDEDCFKAAGHVPDWTALR